jgi:hypothetical protein
MCIIIYKDVGVANPTDQILSTCFRTHKDGFGVMFRVGDKVAIHKGLFNLDSIKKVVSRVPKNCEATYHFRMATHGGVCASNCHPFPLSGKNDALRTTSGIFDSGLVHNGIISGFGTRNESNLSDTMNFIKYLCKSCPTFSFDNISKKVKGHYGKFVVFTPSMTYFLGDFVEENGLKYSNPTYREWGCGVGSLGTWDAKQKRYIFPEKKPDPLFHSISPLIVEARLEDVRWREGSDLATYRGKKGHIINYKGVCIFAEEGYSEVELGFFQEDIDFMILEGEYEGMINI